MADKIAGGNIKKKKPKRPRKNGQQKISDLKGLTENGQQKKGDRKWLTENARQRNGRQKTPTSVGR